MNCRSKIPNAKYGNRKVIADGQTFDSRKEYRRYCELRLLQQAGEIDELRRQVRFELIPAQKVGGKVVERPVVYIADFVYTENNQTVVEDTKGVRTKEYIIKRKLMLLRCGIAIKEV